MRRPPECAVGMWGGLWVLEEEEEVEESESWLVGGVLGVGFLFLVVGR